MPYAKGTIEFKHHISICHVHEDVCKHLGIDSSNDQDIHTKYLNMIEFYSPCFFYIILTQTKMKIPTTSAL